MSLPRDKGWENEERHGPVVGNGKQRFSDLPSTQPIPNPLHPTAKSNSMLYFAPMMTMALGMGMVLHNSPCVPLSMDLVTMAGLDMSIVVAPGLCSFGPLDLPKEVIHSESQPTDLVGTNKEFDVSRFLIDHVLYQEEESTKNELTSNDTMIQNLNKLDMDNSGSKGHSITLADPKCRKVFDADKPITKKKKTQTKSSYSDIP
ncbi:hypothetical protein Ancab_014953 [Ancistrocladus abbreviatus]